MTDGIGTCYVHEDGAGKKNIGNVSFIKEEFYTIYNSVMVVSVGIFL